MHATRTEAGTHTLLQRPWGDNNAKWKVWCTKTGLRMYTLDVSISSNLWKTTFYVQYTMILCVKTQGEHMPCFVLLFYLDRAYELELTKLPLSCSHISGYHYKMRGDIRTCVAHSASKWSFLLSARKRETNYCHLLVHILVTMLAISCTTLPITPLTTPPSPCLITRTPLAWNVIRLHPLTSGCVCVGGRVGGCVCVCVGVGGGGGGEAFQTSTSLILTRHWLFVFFFFTATWRRNGRERELGADGRTSFRGGWGGGWGWICTEKVQQGNLTCGELAGTGSAETGTTILFNINSNTEKILPTYFYLISCKVNTRVWERLNSGFRLNALLFARYLMRNSLKMFLKYSKYFFKKYY